MEFPEETPTAPKPITVKQLVYRLRDTVSIAVGTQWVVGELSNVKHHTSGHVYFTLKEQGAEIFCAFFKAAASKCPIRLQEGMKVHVLGSATVYPDRGQLQLVIRQVKAAGQGDLQTRFLELKAKLQREGLFDAEHKKKIPTFPRAIGIVTSPHRRRHPGHTARIGTPRPVGEGLSAARTRAGSRSGARNSRSRARLVRSALQRSPARGRAHCRPRRRLH